ncbi:hypothetical protein HDU97_004322 [Phlyctochytrium planicorne]|nr:hypothetical protein HDU97_004322 [Phlyctochytrium planicorne]
MATLTDSILQKIEDLRKERTARHDAIIQDIDSRLSVLSRESATVLASLEDRLSQAAYRSDLQDQPCDDRVKRIDGVKDTVAEPRNEDSMDDDDDDKGTMNDDDETTVLNSSLPCQNQDERDQSPNIVETLHAQHASIEAQMKTLSTRRLNLRSQLLKDLRRLDTLESKLCSISRSYEKERKTALDRLVVIENVPTGGKRKRDAEESQENDEGWKRMRSTATAVVGVGVAVAVAGVLASAAGIGATIL